MGGRISLRGDVQFSVVETAGRQRLRARAADVSSTGICLVRYEGRAHEPGTVVELELYLPGASKPVSVKATPIWRDGYREGLRFVDMADADRLDLAELVDRAR